MPPRWRPLPLACLLSSPPFGAAAKTRPLCPRVRLVGADVKLSDAEKRLVCGDPRSEGWRRIPLTQARQFLTAFLQQRGRHFPSFTTEGETLVVDVGTRTFVQRLRGTGLEGIFDLGKRRRVRGALLTPKLLDTVEKAVLFELQSRGYACPKVQVTADARTGEVHVDANAGQQYLMVPVPRARVQRLDPNVFGRFEAFEAGATFDNHLLSLTSDRIEEDALFLSAYYDVTCSTAGLRVAQRVVEAPPRLYQLGVGADTEGVLTGRARFRDSRLGYRASAVEAEALASQRQQSFDAMADYYLSPSARLHLHPEAFLRREDETRYEAAHSEASFSPAWSRDGADLRLDVRGGPAVDYFNTIRGLGPSRDAWFAFVTRTEVKTHLYEFYQRDPRRGWSATLQTASRVAGAYSSISANWLRASGQALWNLGHYEPPLAVLATRGFLGTTWTNDRARATLALSPAERFFLGGDADLRGFGRQALPLTPEGFRTAAYEGLELRAGDVLPANLQPFLFVDAAMGGDRDFHLDGDVYYAPGGGVRWASPAGTIRATLGRGLVYRRGSPFEPPRPHWQFFFSYGREF